jgi:hypothetical protein
MSCSYDILYAIYEKDSAALNKILETQKDTKNIDISLGISCMNGDTYVSEYLINCGASTENHVGECSCKYINYSKLILENEDLYNFLLENHEEITHQNMYSNLYGIDKKVVADWFKNKYISKYRKHSGTFFVVYKILQQLQTGC